MTIYEKKCYDYEKWSKRPKVLTKNEFFASDKLLVDDRDIL